MSLQAMMSCSPVTPCLFLMMFSRIVSEFRFFCLVYLLFSTQGNNWVTVCRISGGEQTAEHGDYYAEYHQLYA